LKYLKVSAPTSSLIYRGYDDITISVYEVISYNVTTIEHGRATSLSSIIYSGKDLDLKPGVYLLEITNHNLHYVFLLDTRNSRIYDQLVYIGPILPLSIITPLIYITILIMACIIVLEYHDKPLLRMAAIILSSLVIVDFMRYSLVIGSVLNEYLSLAIALAFILATYSIYKYAEVPRLLQLIFLPLTTLQLVSSINVFLIRTPYTIVGNLLWLSIGVSGLYVLVTLVIRSMSIGKGFIKPFNRENKFMFLADIVYYGLFLFISYIVLGFNPGICSSIKGIIENIVTYIVILFIALIITIVVAGAISGSSERTWYPLLALLLMGLLATAILALIIYGIVKAICIVYYPLIYFIYSILLLYIVFTGLLYLPLFFLRTESYKDTITSTITGNVLDSIGYSLGADIDLVIACGYTSLFILLTLSLHRTLYLFAGLTDLIYVLYDTLNFDIVFLHRVMLSITLYLALILYSLVISKLISCCKACK